MSLWEIFNSEQENPTIKNIVCPVTEKSKDNPESTHRTFQDIVDTLGFNDKYSNHPFKIIGQNYFLERIWIIDSYIEYEIKENKIVNLYEYIFKLVFSSISLLILGSVDNRLLEIFLEQQSSVDNTMKFQTPYMNYFFCRRQREWLNILRNVYKRNTKNDKSFISLYEKTLHQKGFIVDSDQTIDELSAFFWRETASISITLFNAIYYMFENSQIISIRENLKKFINKIFNESFRISRIVNDNEYICNLDSEFELKREDEKKISWIIGKQILINILKHKYCILDPESYYDTRIRAGFAIPRNDLKICIKPNIYPFMNFEMDFFHKILIQLSKNQIQGSTMYDIDDLKLFANDKTTQLTRIDNVMDLGISHMQPDGIHKTTCISKLLCSLPIKDFSETWYHHTQINQIFDYFGLHRTNQNIQRYWYISQNVGNMTSLKKLNYIVNYGLGAHLIKNISNTAMIDLRFMYEYEVRKDLLPYGAKVNLVKNNNKNEWMVQNIELPFRIKMCYGKVKSWKKETIDYYPTDTNWQFAYNILVSSILTYVTLVDHALFCHFKSAGEGMVLAETYKNVMDEDLLRFFRIFLFQTPKINSNALALLMSDKGVIYRIFSFTQSSMKRFLANEYKKFNYHDEFAFLVNLNHNPLIRDMNKYMKVVKRFVQNVVRKVKDCNTLISAIRLEYPSINNDVLVQFLTYHIMAVSIWHEHVGNISWYVLHPGIIKSKVFVRDQMLC